MSSGRADSGGFMFPLAGVSGVDRDRGVAVSCWAQPLCVPACRARPLDKKKIFVFEI